MSFLRKTTLVPPFPQSEYTVLKYLHFKMGILYKTIRLIFNTFMFTVFVILFLTFCPGIPPNHIRFESYSVDPPIELKGILATNQILNNVKTLQLDREIYGPESIAIRGDELFMGIGTGEIVKIKNGKVTTVLTVEFPCDDVIRDKCGWPVGARFSADQKLTFNDPYGGLLKADVDTGSVQHLLARRELVEGVPIGCMNDLDVGKDGVIYISDDSTSSNIETFHNEVYGHASGRLLRHNPKTNETNVLMNNIHLANGVQLSPEEDFILLSEMLRFRIWRYYLKGPKKGTSETFISGLPGMPDNIRPNGKGGFYVSLFGPRPMDLGPYPYLRRLILRILFLSQQLTSVLYKTFSSDLTESIFLFAHRSFAFEIEPSKRNGFILELNINGEIIKTLQSTNGALYGVSQMTKGAEYSYFVSPLNNGVWYIKNTDI